MISKPQATDYAPFYANYVAAAGDGDIRELLAVQLEEALEFLSAATEEEATQSYAPGKWTPKELLLHVIDAERIFAYRALRFSRGDTTPLPGFDQDSFVAVSHANDRAWHDLVEEFATVRRANLFFWRTISESDYARSGVASNNPVTVAALAYITLGHAAHHFSVLKERYWNSVIAA